MTPSKHISYQSPHLQIITLGLRASTYEWEGTIMSIAEKVLRKYITESSIYRRSGLRELHKFPLTLYHAGAAE